MLVSVIEDHEGLSSRQKRLPYAKHFVHPHSPSVLFRQLQIVLQRVMEQMTNIPCSVTIVRLTSGLGISLTRTVEPGLSRRTRDLRQRP